MNGLEALLNHLERGGELTVYWSDRSEVCRFPLYSGLTSYGRGCRCSRCLDVKRDAWRRSNIRRHRHTLRGRSTA